MALSQEAVRKGVEGVLRSPRQLQATGNRTKKGRLVNTTRKGIDMQALQLLAGVSRFKRIRAAAIAALLAAATAATIISTAAASPKEPAAGTIAVTERTPVLSYRDGTDVIRELLVRRTLTGTFAGTEVSLVHNVTHPDGTADLTVVSSCTCTVEGRTGTVTFSERATVDLDGVITVQRKIIDANGGLEGLTGKLEVAAPIADAAQPYTGRYSLADTNG